MERRKLHCLHVQRGLQEEEMDNTKIIKIAQAEIIGCNRNNLRLCRYMNVEVWGIVLLCVRRFNRVGAVDEFDLTAFTFRKSCIALVCLRHVAQCLEPCA